MERMEWLVTYVVILIDSLVVLKKMREESGNNGTWTKRILLEDVPKGELALRVTYTGTRRVGGSHWVEGVVVLLLWLHSFNNIPINIIAHWSKSWFIRTKISNRSLIWIHALLVTFSSTT